MIYGARKPPAIYRLTLLHSCCSYICYNPSTQRLFCSRLKTFSIKWDMTYREKKEEGNKYLLSTCTTFFSQFAQDLFNTLKSVLHVILDYRPSVSLSRFIYFPLVHHEAARIN